MTHETHNRLQILDLLCLSFLLTSTAKGGECIGPAANTGFTRSSGDFFAVLASLNLRRLGDRFTTDFAVPVCYDFQTHINVLRFPRVALVKVRACMEETVWKDSRAVVIKLMVVGLI